MAAHPAILGMPWSVAGREMTSFTVPMDETGSTVGPDRTFCMATGAMTAFGVITSAAIDCETVMLFLQGPAMMM